MMCIFMNNLFENSLQDTYICSGLCGTYDGDNSNDLRYPDGRLDTSGASEPNDYLLSWK